MLPFISLTQSGQDSLINIPINQYRAMTRCPIMLEGCNERYEMLNNMYKLEQLQHRDTIEIMRNELTVCDNERDEWKRKARKRVLIFSGVGVVFGFVFGLII